MSSIKDEALRLLAAGLSIVPIRGDGSKAPDVAWKSYQQVRAGESILKGWFRADRTVGLALVCGAVSGNLETIDFDDMAAFAAWCQTTDPGLRDRLVMVHTPGPGMQVWYRCPEATIPGNQKLARRPTPTGWEVLIETRGEGGYAIIPPSPAACHPSGRPYEMAQGDFGALPDLLPGERTALIGAARALNEYEEAPRPERPVESARSASTPAGELTPMEDYNARGSWTELLMKHDWEIESWRGDVSYWKRPGKHEEGHSASLGHVAPGILYVFSSNAAPFEADKTYDLFGAYGRLEHGGDFVAAGRALRAEGFGAVHETVTVKPPRGNGSQSAHGETKTDHEETRKEEDDRDAQIYADAEAWVARARGHFLFSEGDEWWFYSQNHWSPVSDSEIDANIHDWLIETKKRKIRMRRVREIRDLASLQLGDPGRPMPRLRFNANRNLLPMANGLLDVESRTLTPHGPEHLNTYVLPYAYDPAATCPRFDLFLREVMLREDGTTCEEWVDTIEQFTGYTLIPDGRAEAVLLNVGEGSNGKSVFAKVLEALVGDVNCVSVDPRQLELKPDYTFAGLYGKLVGFLNEPTKTQLSGCYGSIKALVSGDLVQARRPYGQPFSYRPHLRLVISCNDVPEVSDRSQGWYRRLLMIEWRFRPLTPDRQLDKKLIAELPGILNRALDGLDRLRRLDYDFAEPEESKAMKRDYKHGQDSAAQFLEECCTCDKRSVDLWCNAASLYTRYAAWCKDSGYTPLNSDTFGKHLTKRLGFPASRARKVGGRVFKARYGITINDPTAMGMEEENGMVLVQ